MWSHPYVSDGAPSSHPARSEPATPTTYARRVHPTRLLATALAGALLLPACTVGDGDASARGASFRSARLPAVSAPPAPSAAEAAPAFSRTMSAAATLSTFEAPLDACRGPVAIDVQEQGRPLLVSEHDYCGGAAWIPELGEGDVVELDGPGVEAGHYEVEVVDRHRRRDVYVRDLRPEADVVLQTCISQTQLVLVAMTKVPGPSS